jgi:hypothetical protein
MRPNYFAIIEGPFYRIVSRVSHSLGYGPLGGSEFLRFVQHRANAQPRLVV